MITKHIFFIRYLFSKTQMALSGVSGVTNAAVSYVRSALLLGATNAEAAAAFARLIHSSLKSKYGRMHPRAHTLVHTYTFTCQHTNINNIPTWTHLPIEYTRITEYLPSIKLYKFNRLNARRVWSMIFVDGIRIKI